MSALTRLMFRIALMLALTFALVGIGFAHRLPHEGDAGKLAFLMAGGTLDDVCHDGGDDGIAKGDCPACHLQAAMILPEALPSARAADLVFVAKVVAPRESRAARMVRDPARGLRAPPVA